MPEREIFIKDTHRGLWYEDGVLAKVVGAGRYELPEPEPFPTFGAFSASSASRRSKSSWSICAPAT